MEISGIVLGHYTGKRWSQYQKEEEEKEEADAFRYKLHFASSCGNNIDEVLFGIRN